MSPDFESPTERLLKDLKSADILNKKYSNAIGSGEKSPI